MNEQKENSEPKYNLTVIFAEQAEGERFHNYHVDSLKEHRPDLEFTVSWLGKPKSEVTTGIPIPVAHYTFGKEKLDSAYGGEAVGKFINEIKQYSHK